MAVTARDVVRRYGQFTAVRSLSFSIPTGGLTTILGPNGAGKTSLLDMLEGFAAPDAGQIRVLGADPRRFTRAERARVGVMLQVGGVWSTAGAGEVVRHLAGLHAHPWDPADLLARLDLHGVGRTPYRRLSGGEQQRTKMACALVGRPELVFLDEPTSGLDPHARRAVWDVITEVVAAGTTVVLTTHLLDEAERLADRVMILHLGRIVADGSPADLTAHGAAEEIWLEGRSGLPTAPLVQALPGGAEVAERGPGRYVVRAPLDPQVLSATTTWWTGHGGDLSRLQIRRPSLEDVFLDLTATGDPT